MSYARLGCPKVFNIACMFEAKPKVLADKHPTGPQHAGNDEMQEGFG